MPFHDHDPLIVHFDGDGKYWTTEGLVEWDDPDQAWTVSVPTGFRTDFASVPRGLWNLFPPTGRYAPAAVLHDFLYQTAHVGDVEISRGYADSVLRRASGDLGVSWMTRTLMYAGVRSGGWIVWRRHRGADATRGRFKIG